ncbi:uncharacterized protein LOC135491091 isoform X2 [Lineus longissimus]|uniref:uncharacterized protein LOC135491091 isoform X2 n=1 Tax=Lineus longissimus TaxID=88925 RepID=UPI002B4F4E5D
MPVLRGEVAVTINCPLDAAVDSNVTFYAWVNDTRPESEKPAYYTISWWDNTVVLSFPTLRSTVGGYGNLTKVYSDVPAKDYTMSVTVFDSINLFYKVATASEPFNLTESLNGLMSLDQIWSFERQGTIVSSKVPFSLTLNLTDVFLWEKIETQWVIGNRTYHTPSNPLHLSLHIGQVGHYTAEVYVTADVNIANKTLTKYGNFTKMFEVAEPIGDLTLIGDSTLGLNKKTDVNLTFTGSIPASICLTIQKYKNTVIPSNYSCTMFTYYDQLEAFPIRASFNETGTYQLRTDLVNRVSNASEYFYFHVYDEDRDSAIYIVLPVLFSMAGLLIIIIGVIALLKYQKEPNVETANFGFHIHKVETPSWFTKLLIKIQKFFRSGKKRTMNINFDDGHSNSSRRSSISSYGSVFDSMSGDYSTSSPPNSASAQKMFNSRNRAV